MNSGAFSLYGFGDFPDSQQPEVGGCSPDLSKIEASATKLIANSADV
jgi:hypothetical protein